jgi:hypothetical protein
VFNIPNANTILQTGALTGSTFNADAGARTEARAHRRLFISDAPRPVQPS